MSKVLKIAAVVVGVAAVVFTAGAALGIIGPIALGGLSISAAALGTVLGVTASLLSLASGILANKPKLGSEASGQQLQWSADPTAGEPYICGDAMVGAAIVHQASWGEKNKYLGIVGVLSVCTIFAYDGLYADMTQVTFSGTNASGYYHNYLYLSKQLGAMPESAALGMTAPDGSTMPDWGSTYKTSGLATVGIIMVADVDNGKIYSGGTPQLTNRVRGVLAYDPRLDSTQTGGSGTQRARTESTYAYSDNPWVHAATYAIGRWQNGVRVFGPGLDPAQVEMSAYMEAASIADANGWKISGQVLSTDNKWDTLKAMCQAGGGYPMPTGAHLSCLVNTPKVSLATITADDVKGPVTAPQMLTRRSRFNGTIPTIRCADQGWQPTALDALRNTDYLAADGGKASTQAITLPLVADKGDGAGKTQAAQIAAYEVANSRERSPISIPLGYQWSQYKLGDCLTVDLPEANLNNQKCVVIGRTINVGHNTVTLVFRTEDDAKHTWAMGVTGSTSTPPTVAQPHGTGDVTAVAGGIDDPPQRLSFRYDYTGTAASGEFPRDVTLNLYGPTGAIASGVTWSYTVLSGSVNGFDSTSGSQSMSGTGMGTLTVSSLGTSEAKVQVMAVLGGVQSVKTITLLKDIAAAPAAGGGGGSGGTGTIASKSSNFSGFLDTTWVDVTGPLTATIGATTAHINVALDADPVATGGNGSWTVDCAVMRDIAGTPTQIGSMVAATSRYSASLGPDDASFGFSITDTGLTSGNSYTWRVYMRLASGSRAHNVIGADGVTVTA